MSRIGNKPIPVPSGVKIAITTEKIDVQGPKGKLTVAVPHGISFEQKDGILNVKRAADDARIRMSVHREGAVGKPVLHYCAPLIVIVDSMRPCSIQQSITVRRISMN